MLVDILYRVQGLPRPGELTSIEEGISRSTGGALCNVIIDLGILDSRLPLTAIGRVGTDNEGDFILERLKQFPTINLEHIVREGITSFTAVMADVATNQRTFFHYRGANAAFCREDIDWSKVDADFFHIGYILLLDVLDQEDPDFGTKMARLLFEAQQHGLKTSVDVVSEKGNRYKKIVGPALKYADYCIINEIEAEHITGIALREENGKLIRENMRSALKCLLDYGTSTWAIIHAPEGAYALDHEEHFEQVPSVDLPEGYIKGTVGAGDAFCAGVLLAAYRGERLREAVALGIAAATCSLSGHGATEGMCSAEKAMELYYTFPV